MKIKITENEAEALILMRKMFKNASTPTPEFFSWLTDRLIHVYSESDCTDFVNRTRDYGKELTKIMDLLGVKR